MTYYYIEGITSIKDFNTDALAKFPILFFKTGHEYSFQPFRIRDNVLCVFNKAAQNIFANPISELMEDYGISFEEAQRRAKSK